MVAAKISIPIELHYVIYCECPRCRFPVAIHVRLGHGCCRRCGATMTGNSLGKDIDPLDYAVELHEKLKEADCWWNRFRQWWRRRAAEQRRQALRRVGACKWE